MVGEGNEQYAVKSTHFFRDFREAADVKLGSPLSPSLRYNETILRERGSVMLPLGPHVSIVGDVGERALMVESDTRSRTAACFAGR